MFVVLAVGMCNNYRKRQSHTPTTRCTSPFISTGRFQLVWKSADHFSRMQSSSTILAELTDCQNKIGSACAKLLALNIEIEHVNQEKRQTSDLKDALNRKLRNVKWMECVMNETGLDFNVFLTRSTFSHRRFL